MLGAPFSPEATKGTRSKVVTVEGMSQKEVVAFLKRETVWQDESRQKQLDRLAELAGDRFDLLQDLSLSVAACKSSDAAIAGVTRQLAAPA